MGNFDFEAGKRFREEGDLAEALRCLKSALDQERDSIEIYVELATTYLVAFEESGDPLCLDSARKVCLSAMRRDCLDTERRALLELQDRIDGLLVESQKAEMDAMSDAISESAPGPGVLPDDEAARRPFDDIAEFRNGGSDDDLGH